ncbi:MAG: hypothetical protein MJ152_03885, partial [Clostridia bacterium]|nr:hypothetical protein [Clostridia bacterium]
MEFLSARIATNWWVNQIEYLNKDITPETLDSFAKVLESKINFELAGDKKLFQRKREEKTVTIKVDFSPEGWLGDLAKFHDIPANSFPQKTTMTINPSSVDVESGYTEKREVLCGEEEASVEH